MGKLNKKLGVSEEPRLVVREYGKTLKEWCKEMNISKELEVAVFNAQLVIIPEGYMDCPKSFTNYAADFYSYCKQHGVLNVEICCEDEDFTQVELCSLKLRLGKLIAPSSIAGAIIWSVVGGYIKDTLDTIVKNEVSAEQNTYIPSFQSEPECSFSVIIKDSTGMYIEVKYDGPVSGIDEAGEQIKRITSNENKTE